MALKPYRSTAHWKKIRLQVLRRDAYTCTYCGDVANEVDHIIAKVKGGEDVLDNLTAACRSCNNKKRDKDEAVFLAQTSTPPDSSVYLSPESGKRFKSVQNGQTTVRIDPDSPFFVPSHSGAN